MSNEEWRPVVGYEGLYEVSSIGRVRSFTRTTVDCIGRARVYPGRVLSPSKATKYPMVVLSRNGTNRHYRIHVLMAEAFLGPRPSADSLVRHLNDEPFDNRPENLAWGTKVDNGLDAVRNGRHHLAFAEKCARGHRDFVQTRSGTYTHRVCRTCRNTRQAEYKRQRRAAAKAVA